jgi:serine/threonine protein kinase
MTQFQCAGTTFVVQDKYEYIKQIGHGAYGVVCSALDHSIKAKVAIKKVPKAFEDLIDAKRIVREIKLLSKCFNLIIPCIQSSSIMKILSGWLMFRSLQHPLAMKIFTLLLI